MKPFDLTLPDPALPDERLEAWLDGDLPPAEAEAVAALVETDEAWARAATTARQLRRLLVTAPVCHAPEGFEAAVLARIAASAPARPHRSAVPRAAHRMRWTRVVAPLMLAVIVGLATLRPFQPAEPSAAEVAEARRQVEYTLALLSDIGAKAGQQTAESLAPLAGLDTLTTP